MNEIIKTVKCPACGEERVMLVRGFIIKTNAEPAGYTGTINGYSVLTTCHNPSCVWSSKKIPIL